MAETGALPPELVVVAVAAMPVSELRGAIPLALKVYGMSPLKSYVLAVAGNLLPVPVLLLFLGRVENYLRRFRLFDSFFSWLFSRTRRRTGDKVEKYGALGLVPFVALPLPVTGAWTGVAAAYIFGIKFRYAFPAIALGVLIAGVVVTLASLGVLNVAGM
ncbi:MAG: small multi-drug export protein [Euryarchaeota archaeon]|nr:small multi-drug export protein [Euryarchaeota archaeon]